MVPNGPVGGLKVSVDQRIAEVGVVEGTTWKIASGGWRVGFLKMRFGRKSIY